jgi:uncharacterized membrane protein (DUF106 family)
VAIAEALDGAFNPIFGFEGKFPIVTLLCTGIFLVFCSTTIRHFMTDWVGIARAQKFMSAYQKERMDAMTSGNTVKLKKLEELAPVVTKNNMVLMASNLKPVAFTMIFFIIVFPWIWMVYMQSHIDFQFITLPGITKWDLMAEPEWCIFPWGQWIFIYIVLSFPIGFLIQNGLKYITFTYKIKQTESEKERKIEDHFTELETRINEVKDSGIRSDRARELLSQARQNVLEKKYNRATEIITEANEHLDHKAQTHDRITGLIKQAETMINNADKKGIKTDDAEKSLKFARKAINRSDETSAIYYAKQSQRQIKEARKLHKEADIALSSAKALMYDLKDLDTEEADRIFESAKTAMDTKDYLSVIKQTKATKQKAEDISYIYKEAEEAVNNAKTSLGNIRHLDLDVPEASDLFDKANNALNENMYKEAKDLADQCNDLIKTEREKFQNAQESVSFAKLVISNAISFGASVPEAEKIVANAEMALAGKNYDKAIELSNQAKDIAESAKRQQQRLAKRR